MGVGDDIGEDLRAIKAILDDRPRSRCHPAELRWGSPASPESIAALDVYGPIPDDVVGFYETTDGADFGPFMDFASPALLVEARERLTYDFNAEAQADYPQMFEKTPPQGVGILPMAQERGYQCLVELGGPQHGRVISPEPMEEDYWRTLAWSLGDAVACIRELFELGWYERYWSGSFRPAANPQRDGDPEYERLRPIFERWGCNPVIACLDHRYSYQPERPEGHQDRSRSTKSGRQPPDVDA